MIVQVIEGTPAWVFVVLAYLIWQASKRLRPTILRLYRILITPSIFIVWGLFGLEQRSGGVIVELAHWLVGALLGCVLSFSTPVKIAVDQERHLVLLPGSTLPILRVFVIFGAHYVLNVAAALKPGERSQLLGLDTYVSGASAGYFLAWAIMFFSRYRRAPRIDLSGRINTRITL